MNNKVNLYILVDENILAAFLENNDSIQDVINRLETDASLKLDFSPLIMEDGSKTKGIVEVITVSLVMAPFIIRELTRAMQIYFDSTRHQVVDAYWESEEIRDAEGNPVIDRNGQPYMKLVRKRMHFKPDYLEIPDNESTLRAIIQFIVEKLG